jgi:hypothetical protein
VHPVHYHVTDAQAIDCLGKAGRNFFAVHIDDKSSFFWVVEALADADSEECGVLLHQLLRELLLEVDGLA